MNILILNHHALTPSMSGGTRHYDFAKELVSRGHSVTIVASSFHYAKYEEMKDYHKDQTYILERLEGIDFVWLKTPKYQNNGIARVKNMLSFMFQAIRKVPKIIEDRPDIVMGSSVHLFAVYAAYRLAKRYDSPFIMEVRDLWPLTLIEMGISKFHPFILFLGGLEVFLYKKANAIVTNLPFAYRYITTKGVSREKIYWISNGALLKDKEVTHTPNPTFTIAYTGSIGLANNLEILIDAASALTDVEITFLIIGDGPLKAKIQERIDKEGIDNIIIKNSVPKSDMDAILASADAFYVGLKDLPLYRFGMSMNKIYDYMAAGKPIIFAANSENNPIEDAHCGLTVAPDDKDALVDSIRSLFQMSLLDREVMGLNGRAYVKQHFSIPILVDKLEKIFLEELERAKNV